MIISMKRLSWFSNYVQTIKVAKAKPRIDQPFSSRFGFRPLQFRAHQQKWVIQLPTRA
jgi:hypothetical protein